MAAGACICVRADQECVFAGTTDNVNSNIYDVPDFSADPPSIAATSIYDLGLGQFNHSFPLKRSQ
jgi:hypothetical protein